MTDSRSEKTALRVLLIDDDEDVSIDSGMAGRRTAGARRSGVERFTVASMAEAVGW
jgi:hypothetical protein